MRNLLFRTSLLAGTVLFGIGTLAAQDSNIDVVQSGDAHGRQIRLTAFAPQQNTLRFVATEIGLEGKVVKNAPFSAEGVTETVKTLGDGTKITRESTTKVYRDSEGRTRREMTLGALGAWEGEGEPPTTIIIHDPVANRTYMMRKGSKEAKVVDVHTSGPHVAVHELKHDGGEEHEIQITRREVKSGGGRHQSSFSSQVWVEKEDHGHGLNEIREHNFTAATPGRAPFGRGAGAKTEDLGQRDINGVLAHGTRSTKVIPAGKIGNDRPIEIVNERWYSDELQIVVMSQAKDPMSGNVTYKLTNIVRAEPDPQLFKIPENVEVESGGTLHRRIRVERHQR